MYIMFLLYYLNIHIIYIIFYIVIYFGYYFIKIKTRFWGEMCPGHVFVIINHTHILCSDA